MRNDTINALDLLEAQHLEVDALFDEIEQSQDREEKAALFRDLADKIAAHAAIEEKIFYPSVMAKETRELLIESVEEHLAMKRVLADLLELDVEDEHFDAKLSVLQEQIRHHAHDEEEDKLFPRVRAALSADELSAIGNELVAMYETLIGQEPRNTVPAETSEAADLFA